MKKWKNISKRLALHLIILCLVIPAFAGAGHAPKAAAATSGNKIDNAGFELQSGGKPVGWINSGNANFGISDVEKHSGNSSVYFDYPNNGDTQHWLYYWRYASDISIDESKDYEYSVWVKAENAGQAGLPSLNLDYYGDNGWIVNADLTLNEPLTGEWQHLVFKLPLRLPGITTGVKRVMPYLLIKGGTGRVYFDDVSFVQLNADTEPEPTEGTYSVWTAPSIMNLKRDAAPLASTAVNLEMAKREYQSGQVLLTAKDGYVNITNAEISDLSSGSATIPASQVEVLVQHYVKTTNKSNSAYEPGWYPDALIPYTPYMNLHGSIQVQSGNNQAIWFTVKTEEDTPAGVYTGTISITANGSVAQVPITVKVRNFALPVQNHAQTAFAIWGSMLPAGYPGVVEDSPEYWAIYRNYYEFLLNYHVTPTYLPIPWDYETYAANAKPYVEDPRVSAYNIPYSVGDMENGKAAQLVQSLKDEGLLDKAYYYLGGEIDEPTPAKFDLVKQRSQQIAAIDPDLRHIVTTSLHPDLIQDVNTFAPLFRDFESEEYLQQVKNFQANGGNMWWYGCVVPTNPYPTYHIDDDLISARLVPWMQRSYGIEGNLYWSVNVYLKWTGSQYVARDIWNDPMAFPGANGDGFLLYPGAKYGMNSPIATLRLQAIRDGNQDYEYLWLLEDRIKQAAQQLGVQISAKELTQPYYDRLFTNVKSFTKDPQELQQVRSEIADFIEELAIDPKALILFKDQPHELTKKEVVVYAQKGSTVSINDVTVNAEPIPGNNVSDQYRYVMDFNLGMNDVTVKLTKGGTERTLTKRVWIKSRGLEPIMLKKVINNFADQQAISGITPVYGSTIVGITEDHATGDGKALKVKVPASDQENYPGIRIPVDAALKDFTWAQTIEFDTFNPTDQQKFIFIKLIDKNGGVSDHRIGIIVPGDNHVSFELSELKNDVSDIASVTLYTITDTGIEEADLYFSDLYLLGIDTEAMKQYDLSFTQVFPYLDGKLNEAMWNARTPLTYQTGVTDNDAAISFNYNDEYLFVGATVKDNHVMNSGAANPWDDDSLEIYVDGTGKQGAYDDHTVRYVFRVNDPQVHIYRETPKVNEKINYSYAATAEGYNMEIAIPWRSLGITPVEGNIIGITAHVNDKDVNDAGLAAAGKLALTANSSQDAQSSIAWLPRKFAKAKAIYRLDKVVSNAMNIDGVVNEAAWNTNWNIGFKAFGNLLDASSGGRLGLLWSPDYLYAAFDVKDGHIRTTTTNSVWEDTSVELFVDSNFVQGTRDTGTHQYTIRVDDPVTYYDGAVNAGKTQGIIQKSKRTADGYQVEMAIPWTTIGITAEAGKKIGVTAHLNLVEPNNPNGVALSLSDNGLADGANTANYVAFELGTLPVVNSYTVSFQTYGGTAIANQTVVGGSKATQPAIPTKAGYTFQGWYTDDTYTTAFNFDAAITGNVTAHAKWTAMPVDPEPVSYTVSFQTYGGTAIANQTVVEGSKATQPTAPTKTGYTFGGWYTSNTYATAFDFDAAITGNVTAHAKWTAIPVDPEPVSYTVSFQTYGGTAIANQTVVEGSKATQPTAPSKAGYTFGGWYTSNTYATAFDFDTLITGNTTVHAKWTAIPVDPEVPPTSSPGGGNSGGGQETGSSASEYVVKAQDIASKKPQITLASGQETATISLELLKQLQQQHKPLTIEQGGVQLSLSPESIEELLKSGAVAGSDNLSLKLKAVTKQEGQSLVSLVAGKQYADITLPDQVWEVSVKWKQGANELVAKPFNKPLTLSWPVSEKPASYHLYRIGENGELVYLKEAVSDGRITVQLLEEGRVAGLVFVKKFDDLSKVQWAQDAIRELAARQILKGATTTTFAPDRQITRAEFAVILARTLGLADHGSGTFADVSADAWFAGAVNAAAQAGLINGQSKDRFAPNAAITREEMAVMLQRAVEWQTKQALEPALPHSYGDDAQISSWARGATQVLAELGIMVGRSNNQFAPKVSVTRAEAAQAMYNYLNKQ
ncbi:glycoside hydrolase domain-containing protein [Cohnella soli]|uniref:Glycoside hydrolase domain-containing protein n=1 Tax=Cohnella soli TaxID=425005 RepID=A0ABW0HWW3_9BACL